MHCMYVSTAIVCIIAHVCNFYCFRNMERYIQAIFRITSMELSFLLVVDLLILITSRKRDQVHSIL